MYSGRRCLCLSLAVVLSAALVAAAADDGGRKETRIAALPFSDVSKDGRHAPLAEAMGDMLVSFLAEADGVVFLERAQLEKVLGEHDLALSGLTDDAARARVGKLLGADYILTGAVTTLNGTLRINAHLLHVDTARVARSAQADGKIDELIAPVAAVGAELGKGLNVKLPEIDESQVDKSPVANLHFMRGLGFYYGNMRDLAIAEFMKTLALKGDHARARYWNGVCYFDDEEYEHATIEFARFLKDFPKHALAPRVKEMNARCAVALKGDKKGAP